MKVAISTFLLLYHAVQLVSPSDLFSSMDDARNAIMFFYDPVHVEPEVKAKPLKPVKPTIPSRVVTLGSVVSSIVTKQATVSVQSGGSGKKRVGTTTATKYIRFRPMSVKGPIVLTNSSVRGTTPLTTHSKHKLNTTASLSLTTPKPTIQLSVKKSYSKPASTKRMSLNKFAEAIQDIEKALADAQIVGQAKHDQRRLSKLKDLIKTAVEKRSYRFARKAIGEAMFTIKKINEQTRTRRRKRDIVLSSKDFLGSVRKTIGASAFNDLLAMQGQVTLMFAIDDTGSMMPEIEAVMKITKSIVDEERTEPVDFILSPFNDPGTGNVTYCNHTEKAKFIKAIESLVAHDGGDCDELTFEGMHNALGGSPHSGSPMYVFTDAGPKDATADNIDYLKETASYQKIVINFFVFKNSGCAKNETFSSFHEIAQATSGQVFELKDDTEVKQLEGLTATSLGGTAVVASTVHNRSSRTKRSSSKTAKSYSIPVDDSIDTLVISVTADQPIAGGNTWSVSLTSPSGTIAGIATNNLDQATVYQISKPNVGIWNLGVKTDSSVNYDFFAKGSSANNIDFKYYFVKTTVTRGVARTIPITSPLLGREAEAILTLSGVANVDQQSLSAELVTMEGEIVQPSKPVSLTSKDKKGIRHSFKFFPPNQIFKIKLKGKTRKGNLFERIGHKPIKAETLLVKVLFARNEYTIPQGGTGFVIFMIENFGNNEMVDFKVFGSLIIVERQSRDKMVVRKGRMGSFFASFRGNAKATKGVTVTVVVSVKGRKSGSKSVMSVPLLVL